MESLKLVADGMETDQAVGAAEPDDVPALFATSAPAGPLPPQLAAVAALIDEESPAPRAAKRKRATLGEAQVCLALTGIEAAPAVAPTATPAAAPAAATSTIEDTEQPVARSARRQRISGRTNDDTSSRAVTRTHGDTVPAISL